jgi:hypothetical protein
LLLGSPGATLFPGYTHGLLYGVPPATRPFSATAFLRELSPRPSTIAATDNVLATALENSKTAAAATEERVRVAALAWEHERTTADTLARQVAEAERFLHAFTGEHVASSQQPPPTALLKPGAGPPGGTDDPMVAYLHLQAVGVPHIKTLVTVVLDSNSNSYARWRDQLLLSFVATLSTATSSPTLLPVLATRRGDATTASSCPGSLGPSPWISKTSCALRIPPRT